LPADLELAVIQALELDQAPRQEALQALCVRHPEHAPAVLDMVAVADDVAAAFRATPAPPDPPEQPETVGPYRILRLLGRGGMGAVFLAEQQEPVARQVALKVIKLGMDSATVLARFEIERRALAAMNHDFIARVHDAGLTERGQPWFAMEYVEGAPLDRHCDQHQLSVCDRLELFVRVCEGVQHAHRRGVIHRDLKPANILVSVQGDGVRPKIIDFGLARAVERSADQETLATLQGQLVGTPGYMSPEQAAGDLDAVDTRTDVYSLGVVLYKLLVGALPIDPGTSASDPTDYQRRLRLGNPLRPSTQLSRSGEVAADVAQRRGTEPRALARSLRGDLDWITMKALEPDRERRYQSVAELVDEVIRYQRHLPVRAGAPGAGYRLRKFVRRHRVGVTAAVLVSASLFAGLVGTLWQAGVARQRLVEVEGALDKVRAVNDFLTLDLLAASRPEESLGRKVTVEEVLQLAALQVESRFAQSPEIEAAVRHALGESFARLGLLQVARTHRETALRLRQQHLGPEHRDTLASARAVAGARIDLGDAPGGEAALNEVLATCRRCFGAEDQETLRTTIELVRLYRSTNRNRQAKELCEQVLAVQRRTGGERHEDTLTTSELLGQLLAGLEEFDAAERVLQGALALRREVSGELHPRTSTVCNNLANLYHDQGKYAAAEPLYQLARAANSRIYGEDHLEYAIVLNNLASLLQDMTRADPALDRLPQAEQMFRQSLAIRERTWGEGHHRTATARNNLALLLRDQGRYAEAEAMLLEVLAIQERQPELTRRQRIGTRFNLAALASLQDQHARGAERFAELLPDAEQDLGEDHTVVARIRLGYGIALQFLERFEEGERQLLRGHAIASEALGGDARLTLEATEKVCNFYVAWDRQDGVDKHAEVERWEAEVRERRSRSANR
jgi:non-specific serine/threonine protein kinase/serine/threonine-protein kinase